MFRKAFMFRKANKVNYSKSKEGGWLLIKKKSANEKEIQENMNKMEEISLFANLKANNLKTWILLVCRLTSFSMEERNCKNISKSTNHEQINKYK